MSKYSLFLLLLIFCCCTAYMRKHAGTSAPVTENPMETATQPFEEFNHYHKPTDAVTWERVLNAIVPSRNPVLIAALFRPTFQFIDCQKRFYYKEVFDFVFKEGKNYSFKIHDWCDWEDSNAFNFTVLHNSEPRYKMMGIFSLSAQQMDYIEMVDCPQIP